MNSDVLQSDLRLSSQAEIAPTRRRQQRNRNEIERVVDETAQHVRRDFETFLSNFKDPETSTLLYIEQVKLLPRTNSTTIYIDYCHLEMHNEILAQAIQLHYYRMEPYIHKAIQNLVKQYEPQYLNLTVGSGEQDGNMREFSVAWYGLASIKRYDSFLMKIT
jgi:DNA replication licensing factor MCM6